jgi:hypothetical protein
VLVDENLPAAVRGVHLALASGLWACVVVAAVITRGLTATEVAGGSSRVDRPLPARVAAS